MAFHTCKGDREPIWDGVDWSPCFRKSIIASLIPLIVVCLSISFFLFVFIHRLIDRRKSIRLEDSDDSSTPLLDAAQTSLSFDPSKSDLISLQSVENTILLGVVKEGIDASMDYNEGSIAEPKITVEKVGDWVGFLGGVGLFGIYLTGMIMGVWSDDEGSTTTRGFTNGWERLLIYSWMVILGTLPLFPSRLTSILPTVHLPSMMIILLPLQFLLFRTVLISRLDTSYHSSSPISQPLFIFESILFVIHLVWVLVYCNLEYRSPLEGVLEGLWSGKGSCAGQVEGMGEGEVGEGYTVVANPAEPRSIFSRAIFSHTLGLVFHHYKHPLSLKDVPAIREDDTPAVSLANFRLATQSYVDKARQSGKPLKKRPLWARLMWNFRKEFAIQAFWGVCACFLSFFPALGMQLLLKFIAERKDENSETGGRIHVAVLYVVGMTVGQCVNGFCYSQVLNTGRRICIRVRGILIAEVFTKALRRRNLSGSVASVSSSQTEGKSEDSNEASKDKPASAAEEPQVETNITNLVGVDAFFLGEFSGYLYYYLSCPLTIAISIALLYRILGPSAWAGVAVMVILTPCQALIGRLFATNQKKLLSATDARLEAATEALGAIKTIKFAAWEEKFFERMQVSREKELGILKSRFFIKAFFNVVVQVTPPLVTVITFAVYTVILGNPLTAATAFTALSLFSMLRSPLGMMLEVITTTANAYVSAERMADFLDLPETLRYEQVTQASQSGEPTIGFSGADIAYISKEDAVAADRQIAKDPNTQPYFKLANLDLDFPVGKLSLVCGPYGSGKTTVLSALLGETYLLSGKVFMPSDNGSKEFCTPELGTGLVDTVAYCPQTPWLMGTSIRGNILFGSDWDEKRYKQVLFACALERDLDIFELGDQTICGSKGAVMSGGQKARIALARAMYAPSRILLLDDVLSAVDTQTATHIFKHCLTGPLMKGRTCVLVTHAVGLTLPGAAYAVVMDSGNVLASGHPDSLKAKGHFAEDTLADAGQNVATHLHNETNGEVIVPHVADGTLTVEDVEGVDADRGETAKQVAKNQAGGQPAVVKDKSGFFKAETQEQGQVKLAVYTLYLKALGGVWFWVLIVGLFVGSQATQVETNAWIRDWANSNERYQSSLWKRGLQSMATHPEKEGAAHENAVFYLVIYILLNLFFGLTIALRTVWLFAGSLRASRSLYRQLLTRVLSAKMRFFDSTPAGQILNRLSNDIQTIDQNTAECLMLFTQSTLASVAVLVVICFATPLFIITALLICGMFAVIGTLYVAISREIKRTDSTTKSPILVSFGEALTGMISIRAYADTARFTKDCLKALEVNIRPFHLLWQMNRVLSIYCELAGSLVTVFAAIFVLINKDLDAGAAGLSLSYAMTFVDYVLWIVRLYAANEQYMNSTERIAEYLDLEPEEDPTKSAPDPPAHWPSKYAKIEVDNLVCAYAPGLPAVLRGISFTVEPGERIGVCGRTGSGKSSLMLALFRFIEISSGSIKIDGIDTSKIKISELRKRLTILPQEAQLFSGSIRENLDPFGEHEDLELWEVLRQVGLASRNTPAASRAASRAVSRAASIKSADEDSEQTETELMEKITIKSLDENVAKGAENFSHGARQLFALARGMLKLQHSTVLVMDESTANLDHATDAAIQKVIQEELGEITMLIVAHRLRSVAKCDKILVLDHGQVLEYASPWELLQRDNSSFKELCEQSGEASVLRQMAEEAHEARQSRK